MLMYLTSAAGGQPSAAASIIQLVVPLAILGVVFYFFIYKPQKKQDQEAQQLRDNLQVGDEITTIGGIIGKVVSIKDETMVIETTRDATKIRLLKSAVRTVDVKAEDAKD